MIIRLNSDRMMHNTICAFVCDQSEIFLPTISSLNILESSKIGSQSLLCMDLPYSGHSS